MRPEPEPGDRPPEGARARAVWAFELWGQDVLAFLDRLLGDLDEAEALAQETFFRLLTADAVFETAASLRAWLYRVARNLAYDWTKRSKAACASSFDSDDAQFLDRCALPKGDDLVELADELGAMRAAIRELAEPYRSTLVLRFLEEWSYADIAAHDGVSESALRTRVQKALELLRARLAPAARPGADSPQTQAPLRRFRPSG